MSSSPGRTTDKFESSRKESTPQQLGRRPQLGLVLAACAMAYLLYLRRDQIAAQLMQLRVMAMRMLGMSIDDDMARDRGAGGAIDPAIVMRKLVALRAKLYGVSSCGWTVRQLAEFAAVEQNATADLYNDCSDRAACPPHVTAFPTWEIDGNVMPPGYVKLEVLNAQADALLLLAKEQQQAAPPAAEDTSTKPKEEAKEQPPPPKEQEEEAAEEDLHTPPYEEEEEEEEKAAEKEVPPPPPPPPTPTTSVPEETPTEASEEPSEEEAAGAGKRRKRRQRRG